MRENRTYSSEGGDGGAVSDPYPRALRQPKPKVRYSAQSASTEVSLEMLELWRTESARQAILRRLWHAAFRGVRGVRQRERTEQQVLW